MGEIVELVREFDGTDMTVDEIREAARALGWPGIHIDTEKYWDTGKLVVERLSRRQVEGA